MHGQVQQTKCTAQPISCHQHIEERLKRPKTPRTVHTAFCWLHKAINERITAESMMHKYNGRQPTAAINIHSGRVVPKKGADFENFANVRKADRRRSQMRSIIGILCVARFVCPCVDANGVVYTRRRPPGESEFQCNIGLSNGECLMGAAEGSLHSRKQPNEWISRTMHAVGYFANPNSNPITAR